MRYLSALGPVISLLCLSLTDLAQATPPRSLSVEDTLFGESKTQLFVLRRVTDNLETHMTLLTDTLLVAIDLQSGREEEAWPVQRILETGDVSTLDHDQRIDALPVAGQINPFDILAERKARPLQDSAAKPVARAKLQKWYNKDSYAVGQWLGRPEFELTFALLKTRIEESLKVTREALPAYQGGYDPLSDTAFSDFANCQTSRLYLTRPQALDRTRVFSKLRCFDKANAIWSWLYIAIPAVER